LIFYFKRARISSTFGIEGTGTLGTAGIAKDGTAGTGTLGTAGTGTLGTAGTGTAGTEKLGTAGPLGTEATAEPEAELSLFLISLSNSLNDLVFVLEPSSELCALLFESSVLVASSFAFFESVPSLLESSEFPLSDVMSSDSVSPLTISCAPALSPFTILSNSASDFVPPFELLDLPESPLFFWGFPEPEPDFCELLL